MYKRALVGLLGMGLVIGTIVGVSASPGRAAEDFLLGATPEAIGGSRRAGVAEIESQLGQQLGIVRVFERWESTFPSAFHDEMIEDGRLMAVSIRPKRADNSIILLRDIANATPGTQLYNEMIDWVDSIRDIGVPVWFTLHHEPEASGNSAYGDNDDFIAAWRKFVDLFRSRGATNVSYAWIMTHWSFEVSSSDDRYAAKWYPGDSYVDLIGSDAYNWDKCRNSSTDYWRTLEDTIEPQRQFGLAHPDKGLFLAELASTELPGEWGDAKADWIDDAADLFQKPGWDQFVAAAFFDVTDSSYPNCYWPVDSSADALAALKRMAEDPFYAPPTPTTTTTTTNGVTSTTTTSTTTTTTQPPLEPGEFADVGSSNQFENDIRWLALEGITVGCNPPANTRFCPDASVTRGQMAAFLVRALGYTADGGGNLFVDDNSSEFEDAIDKLATADVTKGCNPPTNNRYCPNASVTRGQMAAFLVRALGYTADGGGNLFVDDNSSEFEDAIDKLATADVTKGCNPPTNNRYCPNASVTRGEMAAFLHRALG